MPLKPFLVFSLILIFATLACAQVTLNTLPTREVGQPILPKPDPFQVPTGNPNLVEGREFFQPFAIALDTAASPPILYVADTGNNRILAWKNASTFANGKTADLVIGQKDLYSTSANGPGITTFTTGFNAPQGLAVFNGDLYVSDTNNNRVLRFRAPFNAPAGQQQIPDFCLGQASFGTRIANAPAGQINDRGIAGPGYIRFDKAGNLWLADQGNNRVLRFDAADVAKSNVFSRDLQAKLEVGQLDFISKAPALPNSDAGRKTTNQLASPSAINFDSAGRLYIADADPSLGPNLSRVLVFLPPFTNGMSATRIMGVPPQQVAGSPPPTNQQTYSTALNLPADIFFLPGTQGLGILDSGYSRILLFDSFDNWPDQATAFSPSARAIVGHASGLTGVSPTDLKSLVANDGNAQGLLSSASTFFNPQSAIFFNNELFVADTFNNRVLVMPFTSGTFQPAYRLLGQDRYDSNSINLIEGKEFQFLGNLNGQNTADSSIAIDSSGDAPHVYISDPYNNRVLGFKDIRTLKAGSPADIVIGQPDFATAICNYPSGDLTQPLQNNLCRPTGVLVDPAGNLYVADSRNARVLRFPAPFSHAGNQVADLVLGQSSFFIRLTDPAANTMGLPYGLAFAGNSGLLVSDQAYNRVLFIPFTNGGFTSADNGKAATKVLGQPDFITTASGSSDTALSSPRHISSDTDGRPYVVDAGNSRVLIFDSLNRVPATGAHAALTLPAGGVSGIFVNAITGEVWLANTSGNQVVKYPKYDTLQFNPAPTNVVIPSIGPLALMQDQYGDLIVAERVNRVTFYFPGISATVNAANLVLNRGLAPNTWATMYPVSGATFGKETADYSSLPNPLPIPKILADVQVQLDGVPCPISFVSPGQINFLTPWDAATGGTADLQVIKVSTGQVLAAGSVPMNLVSPGIFTIGTKTGNNIQAAVLNQDQTVNGPNNRAARGDIISIYGTGQGFIAGHPADGEPAGSPLTSDHVRVLIGSCFTDTCQVQPNEKPVTPDFVQFSGTAFPGLWQVNVQIPQATDPSAPVAVALSINNIPSNGLTVNNSIAVIYVKASTQ